MSFPVRQRILWIGSTPPNDNLVQEIVQREMSLVTVQADQLAQEICLAKAIVDVYDTDTRKRIEKVVSEFAPFDHGLLVMILTPEKIHISVEREFAGLKRTAQGRLVTMSDKEPYKVAQSLLKHDPGPPANLGVRVSGCSEEDVALLLRRAFYDSVSIRLYELQGGSTSRTFRAEVRMGTAEGPEPLPYFVKYDTKIGRMKREQSNYRDYVEHYVPFNHRPNIIHERCVIGQRVAVMVGDFVENSEPLGQVAMRGVVHSAIHSLFQGALRGWRRQAFHYSLEPSQSIITGLEIGSKLVLYSEPNQEVLRAAEGLGATVTFNDLDGMIHSFPPVRHLQGPIHRDLHINNVHVHGTDAILLDFYATSPSGPLLYDAALLEVSLAFEAWAETEGQDTDWVNSVEQIYSEDTLRFPLISPIYGCACQGVIGAIQEVRLYANSLEIETGSYLQALVIALLRIASPTTEVSTLRKAYAILLAGQLTKVIIGGVEDV